MTGRPEDDDVAPLGLSERVSEFTNNEIFSISVVADSVAVVQGIAHRGSMDVKWSNQVEPDDDDEAHDNDRIEEEFSDEFCRLFETDLFWMVGGCSGFMFSSCSS